MQIVIVGLGGQGILFSSKVLGDIAIKRGVNIIGSEVHGMAQRGGSVISHVKIGDYKSPLVIKEDADILLAFDQDEGVRNMDYLKRGGSALINVYKPERMENENLKRYIQEKDIKLYTIKGYDILKEHMGGNFLFLNVLLLGAMAKLGITDISYDELKESIKRLTPPKYVEHNLKALELGYNAM